MGKKTAIGSAATLCLLLASIFLYSHFIGFERDSLARKLPSDTYASLSVHHVRKVGLAFATDQQLQATSKVFQALGKILGDSVPSLDFHGANTKIDETLLLQLTKHFKTQLTIAVVPIEHSLEFAVLSDFYGDPDDLSNTLQEIAKQASSTELALQWHERTIDEISYQSLTVDSNHPEDPFSGFDISWAIYQETLYFCSNRKALLKLLKHAQTPNATSTAEFVSKHNLERHLPSSDLTLFINSKPNLQLLTDSLQKSLSQTGGLAATISPKSFFGELDLDNIETAVLAMEFTGERTAYSGITYNNSPPLFSTLIPGPSAQARPPPHTPLFASETIRIDTGQALNLLKNAFLKAAPLANFPYFGINAQINNELGLSLENILLSSFEPEVTSLQTIDFGTGRNDFGEIKEQVVFDSALKFSLKEGQKLTALVESQKTRLLENRNIIAYSDDGVFHIDGDRDASITRDRFALYYDNNYLTIGYGTLKSFNELRDHHAAQPTKDHEELTGIESVGRGEFLLSHLPTTLFQLSGVLYQQLNNTPNIPQAFLEFDWASLSILEQYRQSTTYHDSNGHLFRVSKQIDDY